MKIAIAGGTGLMGQLVADEATLRGHEVVILARSRGIDLMSPVGLDDALAGSAAVVDVANTTTMKADASVEFFERVTGALLTAGQRAGVERHIALSIVGVERAPFGYYAGKRAQELAIEAGAMPWTVLRATQFHEFAEQIYAVGKVGPVHVAPKMRTQPIAAREVASRLLDLAESPARGGYVELAGPREESLVDMVRRWAQATGRRGWIPGIPLPGALGAAQRDGTLLPGAGAETGGETFTDWLVRTSSRHATV